MNTYDSTAFTLKCNMLIGIAIILVGLIAFLLDTDHCMDVIWLGILVLILSPFLGIIVTTISLAIEKDTMWVTVAVILIAVTTMGMVLSIF